MHFSAREKIVTLLQKHTQKEAAKILGVNERTIRRWKNEGSIPKINNDKILTQQSSKVRRALYKQGSPRIAIPLPTKKKKLREYVNGKWTGRYKKSSWLSYSVAKLSHHDIFNVLKTFRDQGKKVQLVYRSSELKKKRAVSAIEDLRGASDSELWEILFELLWRYSEEPEDELETENAPNHILYISVLG